MTLSEAHAAVFTPRPDELDPFAHLRLDHDLPLSLNEIECGSLLADFHDPACREAALRRAGRFGRNDHRATIVTLDAAGNVVLETPETGETP